MGHTLRPMRIEDHDAVTRLWRDEPGIGLSASDSRDRIARLLARNPDLSLVACDEAGAIVGAVLCSYDGLRGFIRHLAVAASHRRRGLGRALAEEARHRLVATGADKGTIFIFEDNAAGRAFWERLGWSERTDLRVMQRRFETDAGGAG